MLAVVRPSVFGYLRKYVLALSPLTVYYVMSLVNGLPPVRWLWKAVFQWVFFNAHNVIISNIFGVAYRFVYLFPALLLILVLAWVLRSREVLASAFIALILPIPFALTGPMPPSVGYWPFDFSMALSTFLTRYAENFEACAWLAGLVVLVAVELSRRKITYMITDASIIIRGGIWRRQEQVLPYSSIGRLVLEQSLIGRLLGYGTIIPVSSAEWGSEYYTRGLGVGVGSRNVKGGIFYARTLKEVSRDPLKCLYGIRHPSRVKELIEKVLEAYARAPLEQTKYLREIRDKLYGDANFKS